MPIFCGSYQHVPNHIVPQVENRVETGTGDAAFDQTADRIATPDPSHPLENTKSYADPGVFPPKRRPARGSRYARWVSPSFLVTVMPP